jgi:hypothetical protein
MEKTLQLARTSTWMKVDECMPLPGLPVLVAYQNERGHWRCIRAEWVEVKTQVAYGDDEEYADYDEETDEYYAPQGWYELVNNWDDYRSLKVYEGKPSHWMYLPPMPDVIEEAPIKASRETG